VALGSVPLNPGSGGANVGVDVISGVSYEAVKTAFGAEGAVTLVDSTHPLPTDQAHGASGAITTVNATTNATILAAGTRLNAKFFNDDTGSDYLLAEGFDATTTNFTVRIPPRGFYATDFKGDIRGFYVSAPSSSLKITTVTI
jgi:hypothetical protein